MLIILIIKIILILNLHVKIQLQLNVKLVLLAITQFILLYLVIIQLIDFLYADIYFKNLTIYFLLYMFAL
jgi:hypothetical protein